MKLAIVGQSSSGKDTAAKYLADRYGFYHFSSGDYFRKYVKENNLGEPTRPLLQKVATALREKYGGDYSMSAALKIPAKYLVVSGIRNRVEVDALKKAGGKIIAIEVPIEERYKRALARNRIGDDVSFEDFKKQQEAEVVSGDPNAQNLGAVIALSDYVIKNGGTPAELYKKIDELLEKISNEI